MSGQEWVPEPADLRGEARPLSPAVGPEPGFAHPAYAPPAPGQVDEDSDPDDAPEARPRRLGFRFGLPRFRARRDDAAEAEEGVVEIVPAPGGFDPEPDADEDDAPSPRRRFPFAMPKFRRARVEAEADEVEAEPVDAEAEPDDADPSRPRRFPALALSREARVGMAAALSFAILVTVWIANKGRSPDKGRSPEMNIRNGVADPDGPKSPKSDHVADAGKPSPKPDPKSHSADPAEEFQAGVAGFKDKPEPAGAGAIARNGAPAESELPAAAPAPVPIEPATPPTPTEVPAAAPLLAAAEAPTIAPAHPDAAPMPADSGVALPPATLPEARPELASAPPAEPKVAELAPGPAPATPPANEVMPTLPAAEVVPPNPASAEAAPPTLPGAGAAEPPSLVTTPDPAPAARPKASPAVPDDPRPVAPVPSHTTPPLESVPEAHEPPVASQQPAASPEGTAKPPVQGEDVIFIKPKPRRVVVSSPLREGPDIAIAAGAMGTAAGASIAEGPAPRDDIAAREQDEPRLHKVRSGENFWTISKLYYGSGRYYRALGAANAKEVPALDDLWVGAVIRVPPPETLDRTLIDPPTNRGRVADKADRTDVRRTANPDDVEARADLTVPATPSARRRKDRAVEDADQPPARPTYKVRPYETLRSIARDTLGDSRRASEILQLNRTILKEASDLAAGQTITLPADAEIGSKGR